MNGEAAVDVLSRGKDEISLWLSERLASELGMSLEEIDVATPFVAFGVSSIMGVSLAGEIADALGVDMPPTLFWDYPTSGSPITAPIRAVMSA